MGQMKSEVGPFIAKCVYVLKMNDKQIAQELKERFKVKDTEWVRNQIEAVRSNPKLWGYG